MSFINQLNTQIDSGSAKIEQPDQHIVSVLSYVEIQLDTFILENKNSLTNEKGLTQRLVRILLCNLNDNYPFTFDKEGMQNERIGNSPAVDISVLSKSNKQEFFAFEAKILGVKEKYREQEYLIGRDNKGKPKQCGGVERFKRNIHCKDLLKVGMLGYILKETSEYWYAQINTWINNFSVSNTDETITWTKDEQFELVSKSNNISKLESCHNRNDNNNIRIYHYWCHLV